MLDMGNPAILLEVTLDWAKLREAISILVGSVDPQDMSYTWAREMLTNLDIMMNTLHKASLQLGGSTIPKALEYMPKLALAYYPERDLSLKQLKRCWEWYSTKDIMFRLISSLRLLALDEPDIFRIARATFELGIKTNWQTDLNPAFIRELKARTSDAKIKLSLVICNLAMVFMELGDGEEEIDPLSATWASLLTSGIIHLGELINNRELMVSEHLCTCLQWVLKRSPALVGVEFVKSTGINLRRHWWFRTPRRVTLKRKMTLYEFDNDFGLGWRIE